MFCKVCKDAGKTETEYVSHYVKDKTGKITCPTLLNQACRYCKKNGHTVKFCPTLKLKEKNNRREEYFKKHQECEQQLSSTANKLGTSFAAAFGSDTEDESDNESEEQETVKNDIRSYASVLADDSVPQVVNKTVSSRPLRVKRNWADEVSSSDEE